MFVAMNCWYLRLSIAQNNKTLCPALNSRWQNSVNGVPCAVLFDRYV